MIARLLDELDTVRGRTETLVDLPPERLLGVAGLGAAAFTRSVRERGVWAQARDYADLALEEIMRGYLERYEALADPLLRLEVRMHPARASQIDPGRRRLLFMPRYVLFGDGHAYEPENSPRNVTDFATWVVIGLMILDGLDYLDSGDLPA